MKNNIWEKLQSCNQDLDHGISLMEIYLQDNPNDFKIMGELAYWLYRKGDESSLKKALDVCEITIMITDSWEHLYIKGLILLQSGSPESSLNTMKLVIERNPEFSESYFIAGQILLSKNDLDGAESYFRIASIKNPTSTKAHKYLTRTRQLKEHQQHTENSQ